MLGRAASGGGVAEGWHGWKGVAEAQARTQGIQPILHQLAVGLEFLQRVHLLLRARLRHFLVLHRDSDWLRLQHRTSRSSVRSQRSPRQH